ncbi:MAG: Gfo/Idh/MocA family protein [Anaerolineae bacterium]
MTETLSAVLVGCGGISRAWLRAITELPDVRLLGLVDIRKEAAEARAEEFGLSAIRTSDDLAVTLDDLAPDVVFDCTVPGAHRAVTLTALKHGCHVMGEKPLADTLEHAKEMVAAAAAADRIYAVMQNRRYDPNIRRLRNFLTSGVLGRITTVDCDFYIGAHFGGFRDHMRHVLLVDMAIHTFDAARFLTGADAQAVYCKEWNPPGSWYDYDASAIAVFEMTGDIVYSYRGSWCAEGLNTGWESRWRVIGEHGSVIWDGGDGFEAQVVRETGGFLSELEGVEVPDVVDASKTGGHAGAIQEFVRCVQTGCVPETVCTDNIKSLAMVFGAVTSSESGQRVPIIV